MKFFRPTPLSIGLATEDILVGGSEQFPNVGEALTNLGIHNILILGYASQGSAQPKNIRDTLAAIEYPGTVRIGLRPESSRIARATADGFEVVDIEEGVKAADLVISLIDDAGQVYQFTAGLFDLMKPGATLGFSHGFLAMYLDKKGLKFPSHINVIGVCPKAMGDSVRRLYVQASGSNVSIAVEQDVTGSAWDVAALWAMALRAPFAFGTTLLMEAISDIVGERGILLGMVKAIVTALNRHYLGLGLSEDDAFRAAVESLTGPIRKAISEGGLMGLYDGLDVNDRAVFASAYNRAYEPFKAIMDELYDEVASGREIERVLAAAKRKQLLNNIADTPMWAVVGKRVRANREIYGEVAINPFTAGIYVAGMMAQIDTLLAHGHSGSEVCNESIIEAIDSLLPYKHARGLDYMVDSCSNTARRGTRVWAPRFEVAMEEEVLVSTCEETRFTDCFSRFLNHEVHAALAGCMSLRPPIDIAVPA